VKKSVETICVLFSTSGIRSYHTIVSGNYLEITVYYIFFYLIILNSSKVIAYLLESNKLATVLKNIGAKDLVKTEVVLFY
jgi:hypothetical protein